MGNRWGTTHDNELLVDFDIIFDLDLAMYRLVRSKYKNAPYIDKKAISLKSEYDAIYLLLNRKSTNPLSAIIPNYDTSKLYKSLLSNKKELLKYAKPTDILYLLNTFMENASSISIAIHCNDIDELDYFMYISKMLNMHFTAILGKKQSIDISGFTSIYVKNLKDSIKFTSLMGKHLYIANTRYNSIQDKSNSDIISLLSNANEIKMIDMYKNAKYININNIKEINE